MIWVAAKSGFMLWFGPFGMGSFILGWGWDIWMAVMSSEAWCCLAKFFQGVYDIGS